MIQYLNMCNYILKNGVTKESRANIDTISIFGYQMKFDISNNFPLLTTKKVNFNAIAHELLWFISGNTNIKYLVDNGVNIWNEWPYENYKKSKEYKGEALSEFVKKIKEDQKFAEKHGNLGPVYGKQWRNFSSIDQLAKLIEDIKNNPDSRRLIITAWNPKEVDEMLLPPCHILMQFYVEKNNLSLQLYQRSGDVFLGIPFNIASYSLLLMMVAQVTNLKPKNFIHTIGDAHIYKNHLKQVQLQLTRTLKELPKVVLNAKIKNIFDFKFEDIKLVNYECHSFIKGKVAV